MAETSIPLGPIESVPRGAIPLGWGEPATPACESALRLALSGLELGAHDVRIIFWLAGWEPDTVATVCSWLLRMRALPSAVAIEYGVRWTDSDWDANRQQHRHRTRYEATGYGEEAAKVAHAVAADTRSWQPRHGLPADAVVVSRPVPAWTVVEDSPEVPDAG